MSPQMATRERAQRFVGGKAKVERMWGKSYLLAILDADLSDFAFRVRALFSVPTLAGGAISLSHDEVAAAMSCSERQARRVLKELERAEYLKVSRVHNCRNSYTLTDPAHVGAIESAPCVPASLITSRPTVACANCRVRCKRVNRAGWCRKCAAAVELDGRVRRLVSKYVGMPA